MKVTKKKLTDVVVSEKCDRCGKEGYPNSQLSIDHHFGYDSACDCTHVVATICDDCLLQIIIENVPNAVFSAGYRLEINMEMLKKRLAMKLCGDGNWLNTQFCHAVDEPEEECEDQ